MITQFISPSMSVREKLKRKAYNTEIIEEEYGGYKMNYRFIAKWDIKEDAFNINFIAKRMELNKIIEAYNNWQIEDDRDVNKSKKVLVLIEYGKQTLPDDYHEELKGMEDYINEYIKEFE